MVSYSAWRRAALLLVPVTLLALAVACGSSDNGAAEKKSDTAKATATKAATSSTGGAASTGGVASSDGGAAAEGSLTIVATDNKYDKDTLTVKAGKDVSLTLDNKGAAIHNWHVFTKGKDGKEPQTNLIAGGAKETIKFEIDKAGTYDFKCDVHPVEMVGKLIVQ